MLVYCYNVILVSYGMHNCNINRPRKVESTTEVTISYRIGIIFD